MNLLYCKLYCMQLQMIVGAMNVLISLYDFPLFVMNLFCLQVYYLSSALSFYYLYDFCLGPQFSALLLYFIKLLPSLVTILVAVPLILIRYDRMLHEFAFDPSCYQYKI